MGAGAGALMLVLVALLMLAGSGAPITFAASRFVNLALTPARFLFAVVVALACSVVAATAAITLLVSVRCAGEHPCEYGGLFEGGILVFVFWFMGYLAAYLGISIVIARLQRRLLAQLD